MKTVSFVIQVFTKYHGRDMKGRTINLDIANTTIQQHYLASGPIKYRLMNEND